jgi:hypothetical protein
MLAGMIAVNTVTEAFWLAVEHRASVGGRSKYGAITIISVTTINSNTTNVAQCFTATTLSILCHAAFHLSNTEKLTSLALYGICKLLLYFHKAKDLLDAICTKPCRPDHDGVELDSTIIYSSLRPTCCN